MTAPTVHLTTAVLVEQHRAAVLATAAGQARVEHLGRVLRERGVDPSTGEQLLPSGRATSVRHGTESGYHYHRRGLFAGPPCEPCRVAHSEQSRRAHRRRKAATTTPTPPPAPYADLVARIRAAAAGAP